jgi:uncharacterized protein YqjF (DUF2071 family)
MIDRESPRHRPAGAVRGYQQWRSLLFMHWPVSIDIIRPLVPARLDLDLLDGVAYVGVVPFVMRGVRPRWLPQRLALNFLETNVRTYVSHRGQPGVYFFSLDAASRLAVWAARRFWGLPYFHAEMAIEQVGSEFHYQSRRPAVDARHEVRYQPGEKLDPSLPGTIEYFLLERYLLFLEHRRSIYVGQVHHTPYPAQQVDVWEIDDHLLEAAGLGTFHEPPEFSHFSAGVDVEIFDLRRVER